jgi:aminoglycoside phosphotransferase (APT) family kinase protein
VLAELLQEIWPDVLLRELSVEKIHTGRNSDHYRVHHLERSMVLRHSPQGEGVARYLSALRALAEVSFAPDLHGDIETGGRRHLIAMEDVGGRAATVKEVEDFAPQLVDIVRSLHESEEFQETVAGVGMNELARQEPPEWFITIIGRVREIASGDERLAKAERWLEAARSRPDVTDLINSVLVHGHGDLHRDNWLLTQRGPVLIDWEDVGRVPLANELANLIVFGHLQPRLVAELYGVAPEYTEAIERSTGQHALYLYVYWLRRLLEEENVDAGDFAYAERMCEEYFS